MRKLLAQIMLPAALLLMLFIIILGLGHILGGKAPEPDARLPHTPQAESCPLWQLLVHGESAHILPAEGSGPLALRGEGENGEHSFLIAAGEYANQGLKLYQLPAALYRVYAGEYPLAAGDVYLPAGYTLTRGGGNKRWQFLADDQGLLLLSVSDVSSLPADVYDIFIDVGHGGEDSGAAAFGYVEAEQNLLASLYMRDCLEALGLKVKLSRGDANIAGGAAAEDNPYLPGARLDSVYASQAKYLFSNHLNGGGGRERGFQVYSSVRTDAAFAGAVAQALRDAGHSANNRGLGLVADGVYKRRSEVYSETVRDYYFILRESGGYALSPYRYRLISNKGQALAAGPEGLLMEYIFLDNREDLDYWLSNYRLLIEAAVEGAAEYWQL